jgi:plastocyanin
LCLPAAAQAATKVVYMGTPPKAAKAIQKLNSDADAYFPSTVTIHVGDSVSFVPVGFHTADIAPKGNGPVALISPTGQNVSGANDAAGQPFWFNGQSNLAFNPVLFAGLFGKHATFKGTSRVESGLPLAQKVKPMVVRFTKAGTFTVYCDVHSGMKATVRVVGRKAHIPSAKADAKRVAQQITHALHVAKALASTKAPANTVDVGAHGAGGIEYFGFFPGSTSVPVGTTLRFRMAPGSVEDHTATTGPGNPETEPNSYLGKLANSIGGPAPDPAAVYPSEQPGGAAASLTPALHGNGFWNSGVLDTASSTPLADSNSVTLGAAGTYTFYCLIHPFMKFTVTAR